MRLKGQSILGYGKTRDVVLEAKRRNLSIPEAAKEFNTTMPAIRTCAWRMGIELRHYSGKVKYGRVKDAVFAALEQNLSSKEAAKKYGLKPYSISRMAWEMKIKLKRNGT
jgi:hypothetical protein